MANERIPNDPYRPTLDRPTDRRILGDDDLRDPARLDNELQPDPELAEGRAGGGRIAMFAVAVAVVLEAHGAASVRTCVVVSVYVPMATNCGCTPFATEGVVGVTPIETSDAGVTVKSVLPEIAPTVAEIVVVPTASVATRPFDAAALLIVAVAGVSDAHVTWVVRSCVVVSV